MQNRLIYYRDDMQGKFEHPLLIQKIYYNFICVMWNISLQSYMTQIRDTGAMS